MKIKKIYLNLSPETLLFFEIWLEKKLEVLCTSRNVGYTVMTILLRYLGTNNCGKIYVFIYFSINKVGTNQLTLQVLTV